MASSSGPQKIAGHTVERISLRGQTLGQIVINDKVTVLFQLKDNGGGGPDINAGCLSCKISKISQCAEVVCPDIKEHDPNASCSDAIRECIELACRESCKSPGALGGGLLILA
jgi:hypothetical protein